MLLAQKISKAYDVPITFVNILWQIYHLILIPIGILIIINDEHVSVF